MAFFDLHPLGPSLASTPLAPSLASSCFGSQDGRAETRFLLLSLGLWVAPPFISPCGNMVSIRGQRAVPACLWESLQKGCRPRGVIIMTLWWKTENQTNVACLQGQYGRNKGRKSALGPLSMSHYTASEGSEVPQRCLVPKVRTEQDQPRGTPGTAWCAPRPASAQLIT